MKSVIPLVPLVLLLFRWISWPPKQVSSHYLVFSGRWGHLGLHPHRVSSHSDSSRPLKSTKNLPEFRTKIRLERPPIYPCPGQLIITTKCAFSIRTLPDLPSPRPSSTALNCLETRSRSSWTLYPDSPWATAFSGRPGRVSGRGCRSFWSEFRDSLGGSEGRGVGAQEGP